MKNKYIIGAIIAVVLILIGVGVFGRGDRKDMSTFSEKIYVAVEDEGSISVLDAVTNKVIKTIDLSENKNGVNVEYMPHNVQVAPDNKSVWVTANAMDKEMKMSLRIIPVAYADTGHGEESSRAMSNKDEIIVIDPFSDAIIKRIEVGTGLHLSHISLTPDSSYAITASQEKGVLYKINTKTFEVEKEVMTKKDGGPHGLRVSPDGRTVYIAMLGGKSLGILDIASFTLKDVELNGSAVQTGVTPDGVYAMVSVYETKSLAIYNTLTSELMYVDLPNEAKGPVQIYPSPDSRYVYVADQGYYFDQPTGDTLYEIDLKEMKVSKAIKAGSAPHGTVVSKDGKVVYVTNLLSNDVSVVNVSLGKEIEKIKVGSKPNGISIWYREGTVGSGNYNELSAKEKTFDFGLISMSKGKVEHTFTLNNSGDSKIKITKIYTSCMCTEATLINGTSNKGPFGMPGHGGNSQKLNEIINPGDEINVSVVVDPAAHGPQGTGPAKKIVYIETDSATNPILELELNINVTP